MQWFGEIHTLFMCIIIASLRIMPIFIFLPFFNSNIITNTIRIPVVIMIGARLWPFDYNINFIDFDSFYILGLMIKEIIIGLILACFITLPFWILHAVGCIIDNQRGATLSSSIDPVSGVDTSELANFLNLFSAVVFLQNGGMLLILSVLKESYSLYIPLTFETPLIYSVFDFFSRILSSSLVISSPVIASFLITEALLGLLSRFAPQMNAFSLALSVKSAVAFFILIIYFSDFFPTEIIRLGFSPEKLIAIFKE